MKLRRKQILNLSLKKVQFQTKDKYAQISSLGSCTALAQGKLILYFHSTNKVYIVTLDIIKYKAFIIRNKLLYSCSISIKYGPGLLTLTKHSLRTVLLTVSQTYINSDNCQRALEGCCTLSLFYTNKDTYLQLMAVRTTTVLTACSCFLVCWSHSTIFFSLSLVWKKLFLCVGFSKLALSETSPSSKAKINILPSGNSHS